MSADYVNSVPGASYDRRTCNIAAASPAIPLLQPVGGSCTFLSAVRFFLVET